MDIKEIRVGCYYYFNHPQIERKNQIVMMTEKLLFAMFGDPLNYGLQFYTPIQLSEEILLKAGFKKKEYGHYYLFTETFMIVVKKHYKYGYFLVGNDDFRISGFFNTLHHLQNICFYLGHELEIKL